MNHLLNEVLEQIKSVGKETRNLEFKETLNWENKEHMCKIIKGLIALSNIRDGGYFVIGVVEDEEKGSYLDGFTEDDYQSFPKEDDIRKKISTYVKPFVDFKYIKTKEKGKNIIAFKVKRFAETPVFCNKAYEKFIEKDVLYARTLGGKPETKAAGFNEYCEIIDLHIESSNKNLRNNLYQNGLIIVPQGSVFVNSEEHQQVLFSKERKKTEFDAREENVLETLKEKTYYTITMTPTEYEIKDEITLNHYKYCMKESAVRSRGWQYPFVAKDENFSMDPSGYVKVFYSSEPNTTSFPKHEITTAYKSGQVVFSFSSDEDWRDGFEEDSTKIHLAIFTIADSIEFLSRYINKLPEVYQKGVHLELKFYNPKEYRKLYFGEFGYLDDPTSTVNRKKVTTVTQNCTFDDLSKGYRKISAQISHGFFEAFNSHLHLNDVMRYQEELENERR